MLRSNVDLLSAKTSRPCANDHAKPSYPVKNYRLFGRNYAVAVAALRPNVPILYLAFERFRLGRRTKIRQYAGGIKLVGENFVGSRQIYERASRRRGTGLTLLFGMINGYDSRKRFRLPYLIRQVD